MELLTNIRRWRSGPKMFGLASGVFVLALLSPQAARANTYTWNGTGTTWASSASWTSSPSGYPTSVSTDTASFSGLTAAQTVNLNATQSVNAIFRRFETGSTTIQGGGTSNEILNLGSGGISIASGAGALTIGGATASNQGVTVDLNGSQTWTNSSSHVATITNGVTNLTGATTPVTLTLSGTGSFTFSGVISDSGASGGVTSIFDNSSANQVFSGANTYTGNTTVVAGQLFLSGAAGSSADSAFTVGGGATLAFIDNNPGVTVTRAGSVTLSRGILYDLGNTGSSVDNIAGALTIDGGSIGYGGYMDVVTINPNGSGKYSEVTASSLAQTNGGVVLFNGTSLGTNSIASATSNSGNISFTTAPTLIGGGGTAGTDNISIIPFAIGGTSTSDTGSTFVTYTAANGVRPLNTSTEFASSITNGLPPPTTSGCPALARWRRSTPIRRSIR